MPSIVQLTLPMFIGTLLNWSLFGTLLVQIHIYFSAFPNDPKLSKLLVVLVLVLEVIETFSGAHDMINTFALGWGNIEALDNVDWAWFSVPVMGSIVASVGQLFFSRRIQIIGRNPFVTGLVIITSVAQLVAGIWVGVVICRAGKFSLLQDDNLIATAFPM
ncbi:hypothetical protein B0H17DRAFT_1193033 [Mycena rosella]|uniref:Uncharacterized protein n=1 Tax=Mycena rosella TaxID=1033263 RepID=A0AAD7M859_MYCRO|nr:hypothetical protein B0H17DRAFT_1193033 [Mycena rosella]